MIVGVLSDTHLRTTESNTAFLERIREAFFRNAEALLHAGDVVEPAILDAFAPLPVYGVRGNMDPGAAGLPFKRVVSLAGFRIGLIHGWGPCAGLEDRVLEEFAGEPLDCLVYGHSHFPANYRRDRLLLFNPGSATDPRQAPFPTVGLLHLDQAIRGEILRCG